MKGLKRWSQGQGILAEVVRLPECPPRLAPRKWLPASGPRTLFSFFPSVGAPSDSQLKTLGLGRKERELLLSLKGVDSLALLAGFLPRSLTRRLRKMGVDEEGLRRVVLGTSNNMIRFKMTATSKQRRALGSPFAAMTGAGVNHGSGGAGKQGKDRGSGGRLAGGVLASGLDLTDEVLASAGKTDRLLADGGGGGPSNRAQSALASAGGGNHSAQPGLNRGEAPFRRSARFKRSNFDDLLKTSGTSDALQSFKLMWPMGITSLSFCFLCFLSGESSD